MSEHVHTGPIAFLFVGISAVVFIQLARLVSAKMVAADGIIGSAGAAIGALVNFA